MGAVYRLPHITYPYSSCIYLFFFAAASLLFVNFLKCYIYVYIFTQFNVNNAVDCSSVLRVTCPCCFVCVFCDSILCSISLFLFDSLSCILNSVL